MKLWVLLATFFISLDALACSCSKSTDIFAYQASKSVMLVKITNTRLVVDGDDELVQANFNVIESFKGKRGKTEIIQSTVGWTCSTPLISGHKYLIYSSGEQIKEINSCSMSRWINKSRESELLEKYRAKK